MTIVTRRYRRLGRSAIFFIVCLLLVGLASTPVSAALILSMSAGPDPVQPGETVHVEYVVTNTDSVSRTGIVLESTVPDDIRSINEGFITGGGDCTGGSCETGETITWNIGTIAAGAGVTFNLPPVVATVGGGPPDGTVILFNGRVLKGAVEEATDSTSVIVEADPVLELTVAEELDPVAPGAQQTYTLNFGNRSGTTALNALLSLPVPAGTIFFSASDGGELLVGGTVVQWDVGSLNPGDSGQRTIIVDVDNVAVDGQVLNANAVITDESIPANESRADAVSQVLSALPLTLSISLNPDPVRPGEVLNTELTVTNPTAFDRSGVVLEVRMPEDINSINESLILGGLDCTGGSCESREIGTLNIGTLAAGAGVTINLPLVVSSGVSDGTLIQFDAQVLDATGGSTRARQVLRVDSGQVLELTVAEELDPVAPGAQQTYTLNFGNRSGTTALNALLSLPVPAGTTFFSASDGGELLVGGTVVQWDVGSLNPGDSGQRTMIVDVDNVAVDGQVLNAHAVITDESIPANESRADAVSQVLSALPLTLSISLNPDPVRPGEVLNTELTVTNPTAFDRSGVVLEVRMPEDINSINESLILGGLDCTGGSCESREIGTLNIGTLAAGAGVTINLPLVVSSGVSDGTLIQFDAQVLDATGGSTRTRQVLRVDSGQVLELTVAEELDPVAPGAQQTYTLNFGNRSGTTALNALLSLPVPAGTIFFSASDGGELLVGGTVVQWDVGSLNPGDSGQRTIIVDVDNVAVDGQVLNANAVITDESIPANESRADAVSQVLSALPLTLSISLNPDPVRPGEVLNTELTVTNPTAFDRSGVVLEVRMPEDINSINESLILGGLDCTGGSCESREIGTLNIGTLAAGAGVTINLPLVVSSGVSDGTLIQFDAQVLDATGGSTRARQVLRVDSGQVLELTVAEELDPVAPGAQQTYTLNFGNRSGTTALNALLSLPVPAGTTFFSASDGGELLVGGTVVQWDVGSLNPGDSGQRTMIVDVDNVAVDGQVLNAHAVITDESIPANESRADAVSQVLSALPLTLFISLNPDPVRPGEVLNTELTVTNPTVFDRSGVVLEVRMPEDINSINESLILGGLDCTGGSCESREIGTLNIGTLAAGAGVTINLPLVVSSGVSDGTLIQFDAQVLDATGGSTRARQVLRVDSNPVLELSIAEDLEPIAPGELLTYTLTYGNRSQSTSALNTVLSLPVPAGTTFVSADCNGTLIVDTVEWSVGDVVPGEGGQQQLVVQVDGAAVEGQVVKAEASISDSASPANLTRANAVNRAKDQAPLTLSVVSDPENGLPGDTLSVNYTVNNTTTLDRAGIVLQAVVPEHVNLFSETLTDGGTCPGTTCEPWEIITWNLSILPANSSVTVSIPPVISSGGSAPPLGTLIRLFALVEDPTRAQSPSEGFCSSGCMYILNITCKPVI